MTINLAKWGLVAVTGLTLLACNKENDVPNPAKPALRPRVEYNTLTSSTNYFDAFKDAAEASTVDISTETLLQDMLAELDSNANLAVSKSKAVDAAVLKNQFANLSAPFVRANLNAATDLQLKNRTAVSFTNGAEERARIEEWIDSLAKVSQSWDQVAGEGVDGIITASNGTSKYLISGLGFEYRQMVQKGIYTATLLDQIANVYLGTEKQALPNIAVETGKNYTALEHAWDAAYGLMTKNSVYPGTERNFGRYLRQGPDSVNIFNAFLKGRAAIVNNELSVRDEQIAIIRTAMEKLVAMEAISYLNKTKKALSDDNRGAAIHGFNEGFAFIYGLRFAYNAKVNAAKSDELMDTLMSEGFYALTSTKIDEVRDFLATTFGLDKTLEIGG